MTNPDSTTQATLEDIRNHRKKIADNPWPFPAEKMNYVIPMVEMSSILSLVEAQAKELQELKNQKAVCCDCNGTYDLGFNYCTQCAFKDLDVSEKQKKRIEELEKELRDFQQDAIDLSHL